MSKYFICNEPLKLEPETKINRLHKIHQSLTSNKYYKMALQAHYFQFLQDFSEVWYPQNAFHYCERTKLTMFYSKQ